MLVFKFLHIASMFAAVTLIFGSIVFLYLLARRGDRNPYLRFDAIVQRTDMAGAVLFIAGIVFGVLTALTGPFDLLASWLILAYVLVVAIFIEGLHSPAPATRASAKRRRAATRSSPCGRWPRWSVHRITWR